MNPYQAPAADLEQQRFGGDAEGVALGQRLIIYAILAQLGALALKGVLGPLAGLVLLGALGMSLFGVYRVSKGLGHSTPIKIVIGVCMFIPLVSLITLLLLNSRATTALRAAGYRVGLLGASKA